MNSNIAMIPARIGSTRLKKKNLALINQKPLIYYAIQAAKQSKKFDKIVLNADHEIFAEIAEINDIDFYLRPSKLGKSNVKSDDLVMDFIDKFPNFKFITWINSIVPTINNRDIIKICNYFYKMNLDSLITSDEIFLHALFKGRPINFKLKGKFEQTQLLKPIELFNYAIMMWKTSSFKRTKTNKLMCGKFKTFPTNASKTIIVKNKEDLKLLDYIISNKSNNNIKYYKRKKNNQ